jgi:hypothetical protein
MRRALIAVAFLLAAGISTAAGTHGDYHLNGQDRFKHDIAIKADKLTLVAHSVTVHETLHCIDRTGTGRLEFRHTTFQGMHVTGLQRYEDRHGTRHASYDLHGEHDGLKFAMWVQIQATAHQHVTAHGGFSVSRKRADEYCETNAVRWDAAN